MSRSARAWAACAARPALLAAACLGLAAGAASAVTVERDGDALVIAGDPGEINIIRARVEGDRIVVVDGIQTTFRGPVPEGCEASTTEFDEAQVSCPVEGIAVLRVDLGDAEDFYSGGGLPASIVAEIDGDGSDRIVTGAANDTIRLGSGSFGSNSGSALGGDGEDLLVAGAGGSNLYGEGGDDRLVGSPDLDGLLGGSGDDRLRGNGGNDLLSGDDGNDRLRGGDGDDVVVGDFGDFGFSGEDGDDVVQGGPGNDFVRGDGGRDRLLAGPGDDDVEARDRERDTIKCGPGDDVAMVDRGKKDRPDRACERVREGSPPDDEASRTPPEAPRSDRSLERTRP